MASRLRGLRYQQGRGIIRRGETATSKASDSSRQFFFEQIDEIYKWHNSRLPPDISTTPAPVSEALDEQEKLFGFWNSVISVAQYTNKTPEEVASGQWMDYLFFLQKLAWVEHTKELNRQYYEKK